MAEPDKLVFSKGLEQYLPESDIIKGGLYYCTDTGNTYIGTSNTTMTLWATGNIADDKLGLVKSGGNITVANDGTVTVNSAATAANCTGNAATATTLEGLTTSIAELNYMDGVTGNVQTQLNSKVNIRDNTKAAYTAIASFYGSSTNMKKYIRIVLPDNNNMYTMLNLEISLRQSYSNGTGGKIFINAYHNNTSQNWLQFTASTLGHLTDSIKVYGSDGKYFYIEGCVTYSTISLDKILVGDTAVNSVDFSSTIIDSVDTLPTTYQTASMVYDINSFNISAQSVASATTAANCTGNAATADALNSKSIGSATQPVYFDANGQPVKITYTINKTVPADAVFTDTNTKVTSVDNHYTPSANSSSQLSADAASTTSATWGGTPLVTGVNLQRDAKGHVTGVSVDSIQMPANPNTDTGATSVTVSGSGNAVTGASYDATTRKITLTKGATYTTTDITSVIAGNGLTGGGSANSSAGVTLHVGQGNGITVTNDAIAAKAGNGITVDSSGINHADTSSASNLTANGRKYVTGLTFDTYGHVTGYTTGTETVVDTNTNYYHTPDYSSGLKIATGTGVNNMFVPSATASEYGVVKPNAVRASTITATNGGTTNNRYYGVEMDSNGKLFVNVPWTDTNTHDGDTKNTTGTTNKSGTKLFLAGASEQSVNPVTYSNSNCYIGTDNCLYSNGTKVLTSYTNTTYTFATGDNNGQIKVTPSGGSAQNVSVKGLGSAAYTASTAYATTAQGTKADNAMPKAGGTFTGGVSIGTYSGTNGGLDTFQVRNIAISSSTDVSGAKVGDIIFIA